MPENDADKKYNITGIIDFKIILDGKIISEYTGHNKDTIYAKSNFNPNYIKSIGRITDFDALNVNSINNYLRFDYIFKNLETLFECPSSEFVSTCWNKYDDIKTVGSITEVNHLNNFILQPTPLNTLSINFNYANTGASKDLYGLFSYVLYGSTRTVYTIFYLQTPYNLPSNSNLIGTYTITYDQYSPIYPAIGAGDIKETNTIAYNGLAYDIPITSSIRDYKYTRVFQKTRKVFGIDTTDTNIQSTVYVSVTPDDDADPDHKCFNSEDGIGQLYYKFLTSEGNGVGLNGKIAIRYASMPCTPSIVKVISSGAISEYLANNKTYYPLILGNSNNTKIFKIYNSNRGYCTGNKSVTRMYEGIDGVGTLNETGNFIQGINNDSKIPVYPWKIYLNGNHAECGGVSVCLASNREFNNGSYNYKSGYQNYYIKPMYLYWEKAHPKFDINISVPDVYRSTQGFYNCEVWFNNGITNVKLSHTASLIILNSTTDPSYSGSSNITRLTVNTTDNTMFGDSTGGNGLFTIKIACWSWFAAINMGIESDMYGYFAFTYPWVDTTETELTSNYIHEYLYRDSNGIFYNESLLHNGVSDVPTQSKFKTLQLVESTPIPNKNFAWVSVKESEKDVLVGYLNTSRSCESSRDIGVDGTLTDINTHQVTNFQSGQQTKLQYHWGIWNGGNSLYNEIFPFFSMINYYAVTYAYYKYWGYSDYSKNFNNFFHIKLSDYQFLLNGVFYDMKDRVIKAIDGVGNLHVSEAFNIRADKHISYAGDAPPMAMSNTLPGYKYGTQNLNSVGNDYCVVFGKKLGSNEYTKYMFVTSTLPQTATFQYTNPILNSETGLNDIETIVYHNPIDSIEHLGNLFIKFDVNEDETSIFQTDEYISIPINDNNNTLQVDALESWESKRHSFLPENVLNQTYDLSSQDTLMYTQHTNTGFLLPECNAEIRIPDGTTVHDCLKGDGRYILTYACNIGDLTKGRVVIPIPKILKLDDNSLKYVKIDETYITNGLNVVHWNLELNPINDGVNQMSENVMYKENCWNLIINNNDLKISALSSFVLYAYVKAIPETDIYPLSFNIEYYGDTTLTDGEYIEKIVLPFKLNKNIIVKDSNNNSLPFCFVNEYNMDENADGGNIIAIKLPEMTAATCEVVEDAIPYAEVSSITPNQVGTLHKAYPIYKIQDNAMNHYVGDYHKNMLELFNDDFTTQLQKVGYRNYCGDFTLKMRLNSDEKYDKYQTGNETPYIVTPTILTLVITKGMTSTSTDLDNIFKIVISPERTNYTIAYKTAAFVSLNPFIYFSNYVKLLSTQTVDYNNCWACEIFYDYNINICFGLHGVSQGEGLDTLHEAPYVSLQLYNQSGHPKYAIQSRNIYHSLRTTLFKPANSNFMNLYQTNNSPNLQMDVDTVSESNFIIDTKIGLVNGNFDPTFDPYGQHSHSPAPSSLLSVCLYQTHPFTYVDNKYTYNSVEDYTSKLSNQLEYDTIYMPQSNEFGTTQNAVYQSKLVNITDVTSVDIAKIFLTNECPHFFKNNVGGYWIYDYVNKQGLFDCLNVSANTVDVKTFYINNTEFDVNSTPTRDDALAIFEDESVYGGESTTNSVYIVVGFPDEIYTTDGGQIASIVDVTKVRELLGNKFAVYDENGELQDFCFIPDGTSSISDVGVVADSCTNKIVIRDEWMNTTNETVTNKRNIIPPFGISYGKNSSNSLLKTPTCYTYIPDNKNEPFIKNVYELNNRYMPKDYNNYDEIDVPFFYSYALRNDLSTDWTRYKLDSLLSYKNVVLPLSNSNDLTRYGFAYPRCVPTYAPKHLFDINTFKGFNSVYRMNSGVTWYKFVQKSTNQHTTGTSTVTAKQGTQEVITYLGRKTISEILWQTTGIRLDKIDYFGLCNVITESNDLLYNSLLLKVKHIVLGLEVPEDEKCFGVNLNGVVVDITENIADTTWLKDNLLYNLNNLEPYNDIINNFDAYFEDTSDAYTVHIGVIFKQASATNKLTYFYGLSPYIEFNDETCYKHLTWALYNSSTGIITDSLFDTPDSIIIEPAITSWCIVSIDETTTSDAAFFNDSKYILPLTTSILYNTQ